MSDFDTQSDSLSIDVRFSVPLKHQIRFTRDVLGTEHHVLADLLEPSGDAPARVQFWVDAHVAEATPWLLDSLQQFVTRYADRLLLASDVQLVSGGEAIKNDVHLLQQMLGEMHRAELDRRSYVVVIGGGAVLDAVGFAAALAHRGVRLVRLPTTTLAQADSGVGVKNGVNLYNTKNWLGTFGVPWAVVNDARLLETLSDRDFRSGFAEAVKVSLLKDAALFDELCHSATRIRQRDMDACLPIIRRSAELHLDHITRGGDPFEMLEARPLDFGHWSAHKLEAMSNFSLRHGEAVAIGVAIDVIYSSLALGFPRRDAQRAVDSLLELGFTLDHQQLSKSDQLLAGLEEFRQHLGGRLTLTMLQQVAQPANVHSVDQRQLLQAIDECQRTRTSTPSVAS
ncbi:3-dehydroquinate synthase [Aeoliella mucimassa]|nr:3-dehydroquinate synthase [Aeoliella mucimassa]